MKIGSRWLFAALAGSILAAPAVPCCAAQAKDAAPAPAPGDVPVTAPTVEARPGQQLFYQKPPPIRPGMPISVLAFPFGYASEDEAAPAEAPADVTAPTEGAATATPTAAPKSLLSQDQQDLLNYATAAVKAGFLSSPLYALVTYHPQSSLVQRGVSQEVLRKEQLLNVISPKSGATNVDRARIITEHLSIQTLLVGTVDVKSDVKANSTEVTLQTQLINSVTGEVLRTAAAAGAAQGAEGVPMLQVEERAALDAAQKLLPALGIELVRLPAPPAETAPANGKTAKPASKSKSKKAPAAPVAPAPAPAPSSLAEPAPAPAPEEAATPAPRREAARASRDAEKQAREAARAARRQAEASRKAAEEAQKAARKEAQKEAGKAAGKAAEQARRAERNAARKQASSTPAPADVQADQQPAAAPEGQVAPPARSNSGATIPSATGTSSYETGLPVPYGYAIGESKNIAPTRNKSGLKVPAWLGVAGFLTGISFLL